jgi:hypothetical protein
VKWYVPGSGIRFRYFIFEISGKPSFVEAVLEGTPVYISPLTYIVNRKIIKNPNEFSARTIMKNKMKMPMKKIHV